MGEAHRTSAPPPVLAIAWTFLIFERNSIKAEVSAHEMQPKNIAAMKLSRSSLNSNDEPPVSNPSCVFLFLEMPKCSSILICSVLEAVLSRP